MFKYLKTKFQKQKGFTLIELLVSIAIIAVLSSLVLTNYKISQIKARDAQRLNDMQQMQTALEIYYNHNGAYPILRGFSSWNSYWWGGTGVNLSTSLVDGGYIKSLPADPVNKENIGGGTNNYLGDNAPIDEAYYYNSSDGITYILGTNLEKGGGAASNAGNYQVSPK